MVVVSVRVTLLAACVPCWNGKICAMCVCVRILFVLVTVQFLEWVSLLVPVQFLRTA